MEDIVSVKEMQKAIKAIITMAELLQAEFEEYIREAADKEAENETLQTDNS